MNWPQAIEAMFSAVGFAFVTSLIIVQWDDVWKYWMPWKLREAHNVIHARIIELEGFIYALEEKMRGTKKPKAKT